MRLIKFNWLIALSLFFATSCFTKYDAQFSNCFDEAGKNKKELIKILENYQSPEDSLKLKAAKFLIKNMPEHGSITNSWIDSNGDEVSIDLNKYPSLPLLRKAVDSLGYYQVMNNKQSDCETIHAGYIIQNIDLAFESWRNNPLELNISFEEFCELLLPYRIGIEKLEDWRTPIKHRYAKLLDSLVTLSDTLNTSEIIHKTISNHKYGYNDKAMALSHHQCYSEMMNYNVGTCEDHAHLHVFTCRALGIPATMDFIPMWGSINGAHARVMYLGHNGEMKILGDRDNMYKRPAKVFRRTYALHNEIHELVRNKKDIPPALRDKRFVDATSDHCVCSDLKFNFDSLDIDKKCMFIYVFNFGKWYPIFWSSVSDNGFVVFKSMGVNIVYQVGTYDNGKTDFLTDPLVVDPSGNIRFLDGNSKDKKALEIASDWGTTYLGDLHLKEKQEYHLYLWGKGHGWELVGKSTATLKAVKTNNNDQKSPQQYLSVKFSNAPVMGLLRVVDPNDQNRPRLLIYDGKNISWY